MSVIAPFDPWKSPLCTCPDKYSCSPYVGCNHCCSYCYITAYIPNPFVCRPKKDFLRKLERSLRGLDPAKPISIANSSDPYVSLEEELGLTRRCLSILLSRGFRVLIITKAPNRALRDLDVIRRGNCALSVTVTTLNVERANLLEPRAPPPHERLKAISKFMREGVACSVRLDPIIPGINDNELEPLIAEIAKAGASHVVASTYKAKPDSFRRVIKAFPHLEKHLREYYWNRGEAVGRARYLPMSVRLKLLKRVGELAESYGLTFATCREGLSQLQTAPSCDGSHLIPERRIRLI